jgi:hypothetical protein
MEDELLNTSTISEKLLRPFSGSSVEKHLTNMSRMNYSGVVLSGSSRFLEKH